MIVKLRGGVGNTLFQYAFGRSLSAIRQQPVYFDKTDYATKFRGLFRLNDWPVQTEYAADNVLDSTDPRLFWEPTISFIPDVYTKPLDTCYHGYWQSEKYFAPDVIPALRKELDMPTGPMPVEIQSLKTDILASKHPAFISVRRGDYLTPNLQRDFGCLSAEFYLTAKRHLEDRVPNSRFFIFSDDPDWCKEHFKDCVIIDHRGTGTSFPMAPWDLHLMSLCENAVIANSSFSWWGAWLMDKHEQSIVLAPDDWFRIDWLHDGDLVPERWIKHKTTYV
jgi:hypothetical protein